MNELAWHFANDDGRLGFDLTHVRVSPGLRLTAEPSRLKLCEYGLHASIRALDALKYAPGAMVCRVRLRGRILHDDDKLVASEREVLWYADATPALQQFALSCAERALDAVEAAGHTVDPRSRAAIDTVSRFLAGEVSLADAAAAADAAAYAAVDAAVYTTRAARAAADAAHAAAAATAYADAYDARAAYVVARATAAATYAVDAAVYTTRAAADAADAAYAATDAAEREWQNERLTSLLSALEPEAARDTAPQGDDSAEGDAE